jgi:hypothetical protein
MPLDLNQTPAIGLQRPRHRHVFSNDIADATGHSAQHDFQRAGASNIILPR